jgi:hypothetical protein
VRIPIACSLDRAAAEDQLDEWRALLAATVSSVERPSTTQLVFTLTRELDRIAELVDLARREQACCPFFGFELDIRADALRFVVTAPADAADLLDGFAELAGASPTGIDQLSRPQA